MANVFCKLNLDVLLFLTLPFYESWSEETREWWAQKCSALLRESIVGQRLRIGVSSESREEIQHSGSQQSSTVSLSRDVYSLTESSRFPSYPSVEHSVRTAM